MTGSATPTAAPRSSNEAAIDHIAALVTDRPSSLRWCAALAAAGALLGLFFLAVTWLLLRGVGVWGVRIPVAWAFAIVNFVWWVGIGHAGTFISAILFLLHQRWRGSINRFAESMTIFAVVCAGTMPLLHMGRPWFAYWLFPYPDTMGLWPQFRSPLVWDVFAVSTYLLVSTVFWYVGLVPDFAILRDRPSARWKQTCFGVLCLGWRGDAWHWRRYQTCYLLLAGLATPLVVSVHSVVSLDFTAAIVPGWHSTIFPPYFVAGAIFSGFAMVLTLGIPLRTIFGLEHLITPKHLDNCAKLLLVTGWVVAYGYAMEAFAAWYGDNRVEAISATDRLFGAYGWATALLLFCNVVAPQALWFGRARTSPAFLFILSLVINVGMWLERFVIVVQSLSHDYLPSSWGLYSPTRWDWALLIGSIGLFSVLFLLFTRLLPVVSLAELRESEAP